MLTHTESGWGIRYVDGDGVPHFISYANVTGYGKVPLMWPIRGEADELVDDALKRLRASADPKKYRDFEVVRIETTTREAAGA